MQKLLRTVFLATILFAVIAATVHAQQGSQPGRDPAFEQAIYDRLAKINPEAVPVFQSATRAYDSGDWVAARQGFEEVLRLAPDFPDALRRLSYVFNRQKDYTQAESVARKALALEDTPDNQTALAQALLNVDIPASQMEGFNLAKKAAEKEPENVNYLTLLVLAAGQVNENETLRAATASLLRLDPNNAAGHYYKGILAAMDQKWIEAEEELRLSEKLGVSPEFVQKTLDLGVSREATIQRITRYGLYGLGGWAAMLVALLLAGLLLSGLTLAALSRQRGLTNAEIRPGERLMRRVYRVVIAVTGAYFYISIPVLIVLVIATVGLIIYSFISSGSIPIRFTIFLLGAGFLTLIAIISSLFRRRVDADPGKELQRADALYLWQALESVARQLGTRPVDRIFVNPGTEIGVYERGGWWQRLRGHGERCLILGLGALPGMDQGQFCSIIAHEYGHFSHADTAGGDLANLVSFHLHNIAGGLASVGMASWYNPVWWFINGYYRIYLLVTRGASRLQEVLADRYAAVKFGVRNMKTGLEHIIRQDLAFTYQLNVEITAARQQRRGLSNLYTLPSVENEADVEAAFQKAMTARTSAYASHPSPRDRMAYLDRIQSPGFEQYDPRPAWDLLSGCASLQEEMTAQVTANLRSRGRYWPVEGQTGEDADQADEPGSEEQKPS